MTAQINAVPQAAAPRRARSPLIAGAKTLFLSLLMLFSSGAMADPAVADQQLKIAKLTYDRLKLNLQIAKIQLSNNQVQAARVSLITAQVNAQQMSVNLIKLEHENTDTLDRGLYRDRPSQERAVQYSKISSVDAQRLSVDLTVWSQNPTSQVQRIVVDHDIAQLDLDLLRTEQAMVAAQ